MEPEAPHHTHKRPPPIPILRIATYIKSKYPRTAGKLLASQETSLYQQTVNVMKLNLVSRNISVFVPTLVTGKLTSRMH
jgi:hypothetical protein